MLKSLAELLKYYIGRCKTVVNDREFDITARNFILLLTALHFDPEEATPIMLHMWYSALIPKRIYRLIQEILLPLIQEVCVKTEGKPATSLQAETWTYGPRSIRLVLQKAMWDRLSSYFRVPDGRSVAQAQNVMVSTTLAPERKDYLHHALYKRLPPWRVCIMKFHKDGILLPFGSSRSEFDMHNP